MAIDMRDIASLARMMTRRQNKGTQRAYGTVVDIDVNGVTWVQLDGSDTATPTKGTTADVKVGDVVVVTVRGGRAFIEGSTSSPAVGRDTFQTAEERAKETRGTVDKIVDTLGNAIGDLTRVTKIANEVKELAEVTAQYFWHRSDNPDGAGAGGFVTDVPREQYESAAKNNFPDVSANRQYYNFLMNSLGITLRRAKTAIVSITHEAIAFYDGIANNADNIVAWFGRSGAQIGSPNNANITIDQSRISGVSSAGMRFLDMLFNGPTETRQVESERTYCVSLDSVTITLDTSIWAVGEWPPPQGTRIDIYCVYTAGAAVSEVSRFWYGMPEQKTMTAIRYAYDGDKTVTIEPTMLCTVYFAYEASFPTPSFSLGSGLANGAYAVSEGHGTYANGYASHAEGDRTVSGGYAHAEGSSCEATGVCSHAEGMSTDATGSYAHAEGFSSKATGDFSHAEGGSTQAVGSYSHSEGGITYANGAHSHAQNKGTYADGDSQTAIGKYNERDLSNTYALIVGNGQNDSNRSNAMTLDWEGNLDLAGKMSVADLSWGGNVNLVPTATANNQEWSIDLTPGDYTGTYWHVWSAKPNIGSIFRCYADDGSTVLYGKTTFLGSTMLKRNGIKRGVTPSSDMWVTSPIYLDEDDRRLGIIELGKLSAGRTDLCFRVSDNTSVSQGGFIVRQTTGNTAANTMVFNTDNGNLELGGAGTVYSGWDTAYNNGIFATRSSKASLVMANRSAMADYGGLYICDGTTGNFVARNFIREQANNGNRSYMMEVSRTVNGTRIWNSIAISINSSGNPIYGVTNAANFRSAIGAAASSDRRLKSNIRELGDEATDFIRSLRPCEYDIHDEHQVGLIAQDVHDADPWHTRMAFETQEDVDGLDDWEKMEDGSPTWKLDYIRLLPPTIAALQKALDRIDELETRVEELERML